MPPKKSQARRSKSSFSAGVDAAEPLPLIGDSMFTQAEFGVHGSPRAVRSNSLASRSHVSQRNSALPLCMSRVQQEAAATAFSSPKPLRLSTSRRKSTFTSVGGVNPSNLSTVFNDELPETVERAMQMLTTYPLMKVGGTAFENSLRTTHRQKSLRLHQARNSSMSSLFAVGASATNVEAPDSRPPSSSLVYSANNVTESAPESSGTSANASFMLESSSVIQSVLGEPGPLDLAKDSNGSPESLGPAVQPRIRSDNMVRLAAAMKRASMWQTLVVNAIGHTGMTEQFRTLRLRAALERHLLPTLLARKAQTGSIMHSEVAERSKKMRRYTSGSGGDGGLPGSTGGQRERDGEAPTSAYLKEHSPFFAALGNSVLLEALASKMTRYRFMSGEVVAMAGESSQASIHFLVSGKCECRVKPKTDGGADDAAATGVASGDSRPTKESTASPRRQTGKAWARNAGLVRVLQAGDTFGGVLTSSTPFEGTYKAISQCIIWVLLTDDFERVFKPFADRTMMKTYTEALRAHNESWLRRQYPIQSVLQRFPIYRLLSQSKERYYPHFEPVVKIRGEVLFHQGDAPGDVYCLVEGSVLRTTRGDDGTYATGVKQELTLNHFTALRATGRCLLLGEESHILPCVQRYRCSVSSRVALLYRVSGEHFVSALLDDPAQYVTLRERLTQLLTAQMKLAPEALSFAPVFREMPSTSLHNLWQAAVPRVLGRSQSLCEPAQGMREIFLIVSGEVRDPRHYHHHATLPLPPPPPASEDEDKEDGVAGRLAGLRRPVGKRQARATGVSDRKERESQSGAQISAVPESARAALTREDDAEREMEDEDDCLTASFFSEKGVDGALGGGAPTAMEAFGSCAPVSLNGTLGRSGGSPAGRSLQPPSQAQTRNADSASAPAVVNPEEQVDFNPPLPPQAAKRFLCTLGGGWEGLLLDKWPNGWGTTSLVEAWAIPTAKIRAEFNSCPKAVQATILHLTRSQQKEEQGLPSLPASKLPPMSFYLPPASMEKIASAAAGEKDATTARAGTRANASRAGTYGSRKPPTGKPKPPGNSVKRAAAHHATAASSSVREKDKTDGADFYFGTTLHDPGADSSTGRAAGRASLDSSQLKPALPMPAISPTTAASADRKATSGHSNGAASSLPGRAGNGADRGSAAVGASTAGTSSHKGPEGFSTVGGYASGLAESSRFTPSTRNRDAQGTALPFLWSNRSATETGRAAGAAEGSGSGSSVSENLLAQYRGEYRDDDAVLYRNIVREPEPVKARAGKYPKTDKTSVGLAPRVAWPTSAAWDPSGNEKGAWAGEPTGSDRWFRDVNNYNPLPGTAASVVASGDAPVHYTNTALLTRNGEYGGEPLTAHAEFFSAASTQAETPSHSQRADLPKRHALV